MTAPSKAAAIALLMVAAAAAAMFGFQKKTAGPGRKAVPSIVFSDDRGRKAGLSEFRGRVVVLDFWASWCLPCRKEFPQFDQLQAQLGARGLAVVPVSIDAQGVSAVEAFYAENGVVHLPKYVDESRDGPRALGFRGIPSTIVIDRKGREAVRIEGPVDWMSPAVKAILTRLLDEPE